MAPRAPITAFIVCYNEERHIRRCLQSVQWCEEVIVIDSGSVDRTPAICQEYGATIIHNPWPGFVEQKRFALSRCSHSWCLNIDADEEVSEELRDEICAALATADANQINGFELSRVVYHLGRWWRRGGWYPEYRLRLVRRSTASWGGENPHERAIVTGRTARLRGELRHYTYENLEDQIETINRFSSIGAQSLLRREKSGSLIKLLGSPLSRFIKFYLIRRGYREGLAGLVVALCEGFSAFLKYAKLYELEWQHKEKGGPGVGSKGSGITGDTPRPANS